jgi:YjbE family integral membrane protein
MLDISTTPFWIAVLQIIAIDILLGGDNAVVIALACRKRPDAQRNKGIFWGVVGAIILRIALIFFALQLLAIPWLKIVGALLLIWIGVKLLQPEDDGHGDVTAADTLFAAIKTIIIADAVMSLDNVIGVAGAAHGDIRLVVFGILFSIPIVVWGSKLVLKLMDRFPQVIAAGGALLGWIAGGMMVSDPALPADFSTSIPHVKLIFEVSGAAIVLITGTMLARRARKSPQVDIASTNKDPTL